MNLNKMISKLFLLRNKKFLIPPKRNVFFSQKPEIFPFFPLIFRADPTNFKILNRTEPKIDHVPCFEATRTNYDFHNKTFYAVGSYFLKVDSHVIACNEGLVVRILKYQCIHVYERQRPGTSQFPRRFLFLCLLRMQASVP